ncbi:hypothetical protein AAFP35_04005 [Gordonia sp. CPCC 206044]|uniref:hypothetical protein n=1 Tax=Gordonia sp. CPCC 206044 TaxID=3140793 RepID=UPI003AF34258
MRWYHKSVAAAVIIGAASVAPTVTAPTASADPIACGLVTAQTAAVSAQVASLNTRILAHNAGAPAAMAGGTVAQIAYNGNAAALAAEKATLMAAIGAVEAQALACHTPTKIPEIVGNKAPSPKAPAPQAPPAAPQGAPQIAPRPAPPAPAPAPRVPSLALPRSPLAPTPPPSTLAGPTASLSHPAQPAIDTSGLTNVVPVQDLPGAAPVNTAYNPAEMFGPHGLQPASLPNSAINGANAFRWAVAPANAVGPGMTHDQMIALSFAHTAMDLFPAGSIPSNARGDAYGLWLPPGLSAATNSVPMVVYRGTTKIYAGPLDMFGRPTAVVAYVTPDGIKQGGGTVSEVPIPGAPKGGKYHKGHLCPNAFGCPGNIAQFLSPELQTINTGTGAQLEKLVREVVMGHAHGVPQQNVTWWRVPLYDGNHIRPYAYMVTAYGDKGWYIAPHYIQNY